MYMPYIHMFQSVSCVSLNSYFRCKKLNSTIYTDEGMRWWLCYTVVNFLWLYLSIQTFLQLGLCSQYINCTNHIYTVVHAKDMMYMALFVGYMYTMAVLGRGKFSHSFTCQ